MNADRITSLMKSMTGITELHMDYGTKDDQAVRTRLASERGFKQEDSYHVGRMYPTIELSQDGKGLEMNMRKYYEPVDLLSAVVETIPVNVSTGVRQWMQKEGKKTYRMVMSFARKFMAGTQYKHFIVGRKSKLYFSKTPFDKHEWVAHFKKHSDLYRNELLAVALGARGITTPGLKITTPKKVVDKVADGVIMLLKKSTGSKLGFYPGMWQIRSIYPFTKGLVIIWPDESCVEYFNMDVLKLKRKLADGSVIIEDVPTEFTSDQIVAIANSDDLYDMRFGHQLGYNLQATIKSKMGAWGDIPKLLANVLVKENKDKGQVTQYKDYQITRVSIEELMPDFVRTLQAMRLPRQYMGTIQQIQEIAMANADDGLKLRAAGKDIIDTIMLAARPLVGKMGMFAALTTESTGMKVGWYKPGNKSAKGPNAFSDHIARVPFMANGGGIQKVKWMGDSPLLNTIMAIVESNTPDEQEKFDAAAKEGKVYVRKDSPESAKVWRQISAMGADSDGDRLVIITVQGLKYLKTAGLTITENPEGFKAKNMYPNLTEWTADQTAEFWCVSTPRLDEVGKGDSITRVALDAYKSNMFTWAVYMQFALHGAGQVQVGVSAPKYYFNNPYANMSPMSSKELRDEMEDNNIGLGNKFYGLLWDEARDKAEAILAEFLPEKMELVKLRQGVHRKDWKGGFTAFHDTLRGYSPDQGVDWPTVVRNAFFIQLTQFGITAQDIRKGLKGEKAELAQKLIRQYIYKYPHRLNIWCWFLDERMSGVVKEDVLSVIGLPCDEKPEE